MSRKLTTSAEKRQVGRPTVKTPEKAADILRLMSDGMLTIDICRKVGISTSSLAEWEHEDPKFSEALARAKKLWADATAENGFKLSTEEPRMITSEDGTERVDSGWVQHINSRLNYLKWLIAKRDPDRYGDATTQNNVNVGVSVGCPQIVVNAPPSFFEDRGK